MSTKGPHAFRTISEAAEALSVQQHVLRFWETKFTFIRPTKRAGGRRFYRPHDIAILHGIKALLHDKGYTIRGVQKLYKDQGQKAILAAADGTVVIEGFDFSAPEAEIIDDGTSDAIDFSGLYTRSLSPETLGQLKAIADKLEAAQGHLAKYLSRV